MVTCPGRKRPAPRRLPRRRTTEGSRQIAMRVLVTGARGFLGREVVLALLRRGHGVRALDVPATADTVRPPDGVEIFPGDLCTSSDLARACAGIDAVVHLAARMTGDDGSVVHAAVEGTRRLLDAMEETGTHRLVLASSLSVYDWTAVGAELSEGTPLEPHPEDRDAYTVAKLRQEALAQERCARAGISLMVLRPAAIWGPGRELPPTLGQRAGPIQLVFGGAGPVTAVHVENCADAFAAATESAIPGTFNVVDHPTLTRQRFAVDQLHRAGRAALVIPVPYGFGLLVATAAHRLAGQLRRKLPSFLHPARFAARYGPARIDGSRFRDVVGWRPPLSYDECMDRTYGGLGVSRPA